MKHLFFFLFLVILASCTTNDQGTFDSATGTTLNGSYATLLAVDQFLYALNEEELSTFDISDTNNPIEVDKQNVGFEVENIYHNAGVLFIGSSTALHIFTIGADGIPVRQNETQYNFEEQPDWQPCDPVVADDQYAYVTLSTSAEGLGPCGGRVWINELRIYDITDLTQPDLISITEMEFPKGLAVEGDYVFVCEGLSGVRLFDVSDRTAPSLMWVDEGFESYDIILKDGLMMIVGPQAIRQYDYTDINNIQYLSSIDL